MVPRRKGLSMGMLALGAAVVGTLGVAATVFACSPLPSVNLNASAAMPGSQVLLTGNTWATNVPVTIRLDSLTGPVLAQAVPDTTGRIGPVAVPIPSRAEPGYHVIVATNNSLASSYSRVPLQVLRADGSSARMPEAVLATGSTRAPAVGVDVGVMVLLAALGLSGLALSTACVASLVRSRGRVPVRTGVGPARRR